MISKNWRNVNMNKRKAKKKESGCFKHGFHSWEKENCRKENAQNEQWFLRNNLKKWHKV